MTKKLSSPAAIQEAERTLFALLDKWGQSLLLNETVPYTGLLRQFVLQAPEPEGKDLVLRTIFRSAFPKLVPNLESTALEGILHLTKPLTSQARLSTRKLLMNLRN